MLAGAAQPAACAAVTLQVQDAEAAAGAPVSLTVDLTNDVAVRALQLKITPTFNVLTLTQATPTERSQWLAADAGQSETGVITALLFNFGSTTIPPGSGPVLTLDFTVDPDAPRVPASPW